MNVLILDTDQQRLNWVRGVVCDLLPNPQNGKVSAWLVGNVADEIEQIRYAGADIVFFGYSMLPGVNQRVWSVLRHDMRLKPGLKACCIHNRDETPKEMVCTTFTEAFFPADHTSIESISAFCFRVN